MPGTHFTKVCKWRHYEGYVHKSHEKLCYDNKTKYNNNVDIFYEVHYMLLLLSKFRRQLCHLNHSHLYLYRCVPLLLTPQVATFRKPVCAMIFWCVQWYFDSPELLMDNIARWTGHNSLLNKPLQWCHMSVPVFQITSRAIVCSRGCTN